VVNLRGELAPLPLRNPIARDTRQAAWNKFKNEKFIIMPTTSHRRQYVFILAFFLLANTTVAIADSLPAQLEMRVIQPPKPMKAEEKYYLVYEMYLTNYHHVPINLSTLEVNLDSPMSFTFTDQALTQLIHPLDSKSLEEKPLTFQPGITKLAFMWIPLDYLSVIPTSLTHRITINGHLHDEDMTLNATTTPITINHTPSLTISAPLRGDNWFTTNGPSNTSEHRISHLIINGEDYFSQRFAIDFVQIGLDGNTYHNDEFNNENYYCYGKNALAVSAGVIVAVRNGIPENIPHSDKTAVPITLDTVGGNYVIIDLGNDNYAFYAHLIPGSITVKIGDRVSRGQVIGKVGNSGNSTEPHLHFHIVDKPSPLAANGMPYGIDHFAIRPSQLIPGNSLRVRILNDKLKFYSNQLVLENNVVKFSP